MIEAILENVGQAGIQPFRMLSPTNALVVHSSQAPGFFKEIELLFVKPVLHFDQNVEMGEPILVKL